MNGPSCQSPAAPRRARRRAPASAVRPLICILAVAISPGAAAPARQAAVARRPEPPRALSPRGIENLVAFARLLGYVRFFHPSDQAAAANWNQIALAGVRIAEPAADARDLVRALTAIFHPLAPTLRLFVTGEALSLPAAPAELLPAAGAASPRILMWRHFGVGLDNPNWHSERIDNQAPFGYGTVAQAVPAASFRGRRVRLEAQVRAEVAAGGRAQLFLRVDRAGGMRGFFDNMAERPIVEPVWASYAIEGEIAPDAESIVVGLVLTGAGRVFLDEVTLRPVGGSPVANPLANPGFDEGEPGRAPPGWTVPYDSIRAGYQFLLARGSACRHGGCAEVVADPTATPRFPKPAETLTLELGGGVSARLPLTVYADPAGTLPHLPRSGATVPPPAEPSGDDRTTRLAGVALLWPVLQHFHPYLGSSDGAGAELARALPRALAEAAEDAGADAFERTLQRLLAVLPDGIAGVGRRGEIQTHQPPFLWEWIEGRLAIVWVAPAGKPLQAGDVVVDIEGSPAAQALAEMEARTSAATPEWRRTRALARLAAGREGEPLKLAVARQGGPPLAVTLPRSVPLETVVDARRQPITLLRPGIFYLDLRRLEDPQIQAVLPRLAAARGLIFDLRGLSNASTVILSHLTDRQAASSNWQKPITIRPDRQEVDLVTTIWTIPAREPRLRAKVAFLADSRTHGYSETLLLMVEHYRWGEIVGGRTASSNGDLNWLTLPGGCGVQWTGLKVVKHDGSPFQGVGVVPTVPVSPTLRGIAAGRDEVLDKALEVVDGAAAPGPPIGADPAPPARQEASPCS
jgi:C-terminal processing protease CtpA/Prc